MNNSGTKISTCLNIKADHKELIEGFNCNWPHNIARLRNKVAVEI